MTDNVDEVKEVIILDPGLRECGGHHPATLLNLASIFKRYDSVELKVYCHTDCDANFVNSINNPKVVVQPFFMSEYYKDFYKSFSYGQSQEYIRQLASEYQKVFLQHHSTGTRKQLFFVHTLDWQHAASLNIALESVFGKAEQPEIMIFLMYSPLRKNSKGRIDLTRKLNFSIAFRRLLDSDNVKCFASDYEIAYECKKLLKRPIPIHPCFLFADDRDGIEEEVSIANQTDILLYVGDAKSNKGFLRLPSLVKQMQNNAALANYNFVLQYTLTNGEPELAEVDASLTELASSNSNIKLLKHFIPQSEMCTLFDNACALVFHYDEEIYEFQSSGLLWMASYFEVKALLIGESWLNREASRLGMVFKKTDFESADFSLVELLSMRSNDNKSDYAEFLHQHFGDWLGNEVA